MLGETAIKGAYENFGGGGSKHEQYLPGSMFADVDTLAFDDDARAEASALGLALVDAYFRQDDVDRQLTPCTKRSAGPQRHLALRLTTGRSLPTSPVSASATSHKA